MSAEAEEPLVSGPEIEPQKKELAKLIFDVVVLLVRLNVEFKTRAFEERFKKVSPNHVTIAGFVLEAVYNISLVYLESKGVKLSFWQKMLLAAAKLGFMSADLVDGALSRAKEVAGRPHDSQFGLKLDTSLDRFGIAIDDITKAVLAYYQEENLAVLFAELGAILAKFLTDPMTSHANAKIKTEGKEDKKESDSLFGFGGTHPYRKLQALFVNLFPTIHSPLGEVPTLLVVGWFGILGNLRQTEKRRKILEDPEYPVTLDADTRKAAEESIVLLEKIRAITTTLGVSAISVIAVLAIARNKHEQ